MSNTPTLLDPQRVAALAEALEKAGIRSDQPDAKPLPKVLAFQAFGICDLGNRPEWDDLVERLGPGAAYYRKMAQLCLRALRRPHMPEELVEHMTYAWGYFNGRLEAVIDQIKETDES